MSVKKGSKVKIEYEGKLENGEIFDSSNRGGEQHPIEFNVGEGRVIPGFENAVIGMNLGEEKEFEINPEDAYGEIKEELVREVPKSAFPENQEPKEGMVVVLSAQNGQQFPVKIKEVKDDAIVLDMNHPLAGKKLIFKIKVTGIDEGESAAAAV